MLHALVGCDDLSYLPSGPSASQALDVGGSNSAVGFAAVENAANLDAVGIGANEEEAVVAYAEPKLFSSLESLYVARTRFRKAMQRGEDMHCGGLA